LAKKKKYEKPLIVNLGAVSSAQGQQLTPAGLCSQGNSPTGIGMNCETGGQNTYLCLLGLGFLGVLDVCTVGNTARSVCSNGNAVG